jgi:hypothetical protein
VRSQTLIGIGLLVVLAFGEGVRAQESPVPLQRPPSQAAPCVQPPPLLRLQDYNGPLQKTVGLFARKLDRKAVHPPHYQLGLTLCSLNAKDTFLLFVHDTVDPVTFIVAGFNAGIDQALNNDPSFGQGAAGYGQRFSADFADQASFNFFKDFAYPSIFSEDPRYYRIIEGSRGRRLWHAVNHSFLAYHYDGTRTFNFSELLGTTSVVAVGDLYHPGNKSGFAPIASQVGIYVLEDIAFDTLREFWPDIAHKFKLPFRAEPDVSRAAPDVPTQ